MKLLYLLIFVSVAIDSYCQNGHLAIKNISKGKDFSFPIIQSTDSLSGLKINTYLQLAELELLEGRENRDIFEVVSFNDGRIYGGKVGISYEILHNTKNNLAIRFNQASCGMTCAYWLRYYNFNPANGDRYYLQDFFNPKEFESFKKMMIGKRKKNLLAQVDKSSPLLLDLFPAIERDDMEEYYFTKDSIYVDNDNLLGKQDKFTDINHVTSIAIADIMHLLNGYGVSALITAKNLGDFTSGQEPQLYFGEIDGKYGFVLLFKQSYENEFYGVYAYMKYGIGLNLRGELNDGEFVFKEENRKLEITGGVSFKRMNSELIGTWSNVKKTKTLPLIARRK